MSNLNPYSFFFETPLYTKIKITDENRAEFTDLIKFQGLIDAYNPSLKENTTYKCIHSPGTSSSNASIALNVKFQDWSKPGDYILECRRTSERILVYIFWDFDKSELQKVGQFPSIADFHISKIKMYDKVLTKEQLKEFTRAIGLAANGVGIGSFVYLRRIFEALIFAAYEKAKAENTLFDDAKYMDFRTADKIDYLKDYLPSFLSENKILYSILSKGIHELKEAECLEYFEVVKVGIELILDEKVDEYNKRLKLEDIRNKITSVHGKIANK